MHFSYFLIKIFHLLLLLCRVLKLYQNQNHQLKFLINFVKFELGMCDLSSEIVFDNQPTDSTKLSEKKKEKKTIKSENSDKSTQLALVKVDNTDTNNNDKFSFYNAYLNVSYAKRGGKSNKLVKKRINTHHFLTISLIQYICNLLNSQNSQLAENQFQGK